jgi:hypothetical protein
MDWVKRIRIGRLSGDMDEEWAPLKKIAVP